MHSEIRRDQRSWTVSTSSQEIAPANPKRIGVIISSPPSFGSSGSVTYDGADTSASDSTAAGGLLAYTCPAGKQGLVVGASCYLNAGVAPLMRLRAFRGIGYRNVYQGVAPVLLAPNITLQAGDHIDWDVLTGGAGSTVDLTLSVQLVGGGGSGPGYVTVNFGNPAVIDNGINIYGGTLPLELLVERVGAALKEEIHAIGSTTGLKISVLDIFAP